MWQILLCSVFSQYFLQGPGNVHQIFFDYKLQLCSTSHERAIDSATWAEML